MSLPIVAIVGRPNVGKSSLFNALAGRRLSIVEPTPGVTRDRISTVCDIDEVFFELVDTGGYGVDDADDLTEHVERQIRYAVDRAGLILFVVDTRAGVVPLDMTVAKMLRAHHDRVALVANKTDEGHLAPQAAEFARLGFGEPLCVSAEHGYGKQELQERIAEDVRLELAAPPADPVMKVAIVGKRNSGKSTFINALAGEERVIVSEVAGTTRDAVDVRFEIDGRSLLAIDTAGVRKRSRIANAIEFYAFHRAQKSIDRADVVLLILDAEVPVGQVDKKLAAYLVESYKPVVIVVNKWDLAKGRASTDEFGDYLTKTLMGLDHAPVVFTSAVSNRNTFAAIDVASALFKQYHTRVSTGRLNQALSKVLAVRGPSFKRRGTPPKVLYATQVAAAPPTIVLFVNKPSAFDDAYLRFLTARLQVQLPFAEVPIRLLLRTRRAEGQAAQHPTLPRRPSRRR